jgi:alpha-acetolactate decarboxylase
MAERVQHTLYQVSTATALGTFESLDGEMVVVDGHFFQVRSDGSVREVQHNVLSPFAAGTAFFRISQSLWRIARICPT